MDQIKDLSAFQGVILSADNCYSFTKITSKGGNEEKVKYIIEKLSNFLQEKNYIRDDGVVEENVDNYRKLALYLILNADFPVLEDMTETEGMEAVIWALPTVPGFLLCELLWALHMGAFAVEAVAVARPALALQLASCLTHHMRYLDPTKHLPRARLLASAVYRFITRLHFYARIDETLLSAALEAFRTCVKNFVDPPNAEKLHALSRDRQYRHLGDSLLVLLELIEECVTRHSGRESLRTGRSEDLYLATHAPDGFAAESLDFDVCDGPDEAIRLCLSECHAALLDAGAVLVMGVSVDAFCAWSEHEEAGVSLQRTVGELCYRVRSTLTTARGLPDHRLADMLRQLSRAPQSPAAAAACVDVAELARRARAGAGAAAWRAAALTRPDLCRHLLLLHPLEAHLSDFDEDQCHVLFDRITDSLNREDQENSEYLKVLAVKAFRRCEVGVERNIVRRVFAERLHDELESSHFEDDANEIFNKLTAAGGAGAADVLAAFLQNPRRTLGKIFKMAAENAQQADIMLTVMDELRPYSDAYYARDTESCVIEVTNFAFVNYLDTEKKIEVFVGFICGLKERGILLENKLLLQVAMPRLHAALLQQDIAGIDAQLRVLSSALGASGLRPYRAPTLAMLAQVLGALRWSPAAFRPAAPAARDRALALLEHIFDSYGDEDMPEKERSWLWERLRRLHPLDAPHLARARPAPPPPAALMLQSLCVLSAREWRFPLLAAWRARGAALVTAPAAALRRRAARAEPACLLYALGNFVVHIQKNYFSTPPTSQQVLLALRSVAGVVEAVEEPHTEDFAAALAPLVALLPPAHEGQGEGAGEGERRGRAEAARVLRRVAPDLARALCPDNPP